MADQDAACLSAVSIVASIAVTISAAISNSFSQSLVSSLRLIYATPCLPTTASAATSHIPAIVYYLDDRRRGFLLSHLWLFIRPFLFYSLNVYSTDNSIKRGLCLVPEEECHLTIDFEHSNEL